jgi:hypothetical protein
MAATPPTALRAQTRRSPIETLLEGHPGDMPLRVEETIPAVAVVGAVAASREAARTSPRAAAAATAPTSVPARGPAAPLPPQPTAESGLTDEPLPAVQDVALGLLSLLAEQAQRAGNAALSAGRDVLVRWVTLVRAVSPSVATARVDAGILALGERGRRVRAESSEAISSSVNAAVLSTVTSDAARELTIVAVERATQDVIAVVMPAMLDALREEETEAALDEMLAGLLVRQLPAAMEKTLPTLLVRTATRPTQLVPFLGGVLPRT